ncbi:CPBP family intramembrane glutamic endopeptidase [Abyssisolibacter fermentans]|uniref:CPBP family intramembrane glutamic endopeptidase n=1 Tax=Abyssisolibacter fermentans TaxID=1766203 RepID=UPI0008374230|nr:CPBP family intramembrane glutamic endopeptidase [Abyssisolibacter fermentans]
MRNEIRKFIGLTFLTSWTLWGLVVILTQLKIMKFETPLLMTIFVLGGNAPAICEIWLKKRSSSKEGYKAFLKNIINPKHHIFWYVFIIVVVLINSVIQTIVPKQPFYVAIVTLPIMIIGGGLEEIGWRGFLQPCLEKRYSPFISTLYVGIIWALWHIPLFYIVGTNQSSDMNLLCFFINALGLSFLLSVVYSGTKSIFMCIFCHSFINSCLEVFAMSGKVINNLVVLLINVIIFITYQYIKSKYRENVKVG